MGDALVTAPLPQVTFTTVGSHQSPTSDDNASIDHNSLLHPEWEANYFGASESSSSNDSGSILSTAEFSSLRQSYLSRHPAPRFTMSLRRMSVSSWSVEPVRRTKSTTF